MKKIRLRKRIIFVTTSLLTVLSVLLLLVSGSYIRSSTENALKKSMIETAEIAASRIEDQLQFNASLAISLADRVGFLWNKNENGQALTEYGPLENQLENLGKAFGFIDIVVLDNHGTIVTGSHKMTSNVQSDYYQAIAVRGEKYYFTDITLGQIDDEMVYTINYAAPIRSNSGEFLGILVCKKDAQEVSDTVVSTKVGKLGMTFVMDNNGQCIAHEDKNQLFKRVEFLEKSNNPQFSSLNRLWERMHDETEGFTEYELDGKRFAAFTTIDGSHNWTLAVTTSQAEFMADTNKAVFLFAVITLVMLIISSLLVFRFINPITSRIEKITDRIGLLAAGDLTTPVEEDLINDEVGRLTASTKQLINEFHNIIGDIRNALSEISLGNLTVETQGEYRGDFISIKQAIDQGITRTSKMLMQITYTAEEVARGSAQMSEGAIGLAQGAAEQASSVEELFNTVSNLVNQASNIAHEKYKPHKKMDEFGDYLEWQEEGFIEKRMEAAETIADKLLIAMQRVIVTALDIRELAASIESISTETGILALNASVEAAHAGDAGRGFAVIATEIRQLAAKSKDAAKAANQQLDNIMRAVDRGSDTIEDTIVSVSEITISLDQIKNALEHISNVIEKTASTAEETASSSEELNMQADSLKALVGSFVYKDR